MGSRLAAVGLAMAIWVFACAPGASIQPTAVARTPVSCGIRHMPKVTLAFHADQAFTPAERAVMVSATEALYEQTAGEFWAMLLFDSLWRAPAEPYTVRRGAPTDDDVVAEDTLLNTHVYAFCEGNVSQNHAHIVLVPSRSPPAQLFKSVVMHEMLHAIGCQHVPHDDSVMSSGVVYDRPPTCINKFDADEVCLHLKCVPSDLNYCE